MNKRPKSREETPKEGSDNASVTAPQQYATALHKTQGGFNYFLCKKLRPCGCSREVETDIILKYFKCLNASPALNRSRIRTAVVTLSDL
jgi:hypothetical protein